MKGSTAIIPDTPAQEPVVAAAFQKLGVPYVLKGGEFYSTSEGDKVSDYLDENGVLHDLVALTAWVDV